MTTALNIITEAQALPYRSIVSNKKAKSEDIFTFGKFLLKVSTLSRGVTLYYLKNHTPCLFVLSGYDETTGTVQRNINSLPQAPQVVATIAEIISKELGENMRTPLALVRLPVNGVKADVVTRIIQRYVRKTAPKFEVTGVVHTDGSKFQYVLIQRKDVDIDMDKVFGVGDKLQLRSVASLPEPTEEVNKAFEKVDAQIKAKTPIKINIGMISGGKDITDLPEPAQNFLVNNPSPVTKMANGEVNASEFDPNEEIFGKVNPTHARTSSLPVRPTVNKLLGIYTKKSEYSLGDNETPKSDFRQRVHELGEWLEKNPVTMEDVFNGTPVMKELDGHIDEIVELAYPDDDLNGKLYAKQKALGELLNDGLFNPHMLSIHAAYEEFPGDVAPEFVKTIKKYCGLSFETVNRFLLNGELRAEQGEIENIIKSMDRAFTESASIVPKDTVVYRSMAFPDWMFIETLEDKVFHFRTYVSTSLSPYVGLTFAGAGLKPVVGCSYIDDPDEISTEPMFSKISTSMAIRDIHTVPVIIPGKISNSPRECELILPRGTTIRLNKVAIGRGAVYMSRKIDSAIMDCSVVDPSELSESVEIFDGDELFRTGRLVEYKGGFTGFVRGVDIMSEQKKPSGDVANEIKMYQISNLARKAGLKGKEKDEEEQSDAKFSSDLFSSTRKPRK